MSDPWDEVQRQLKDLGPAPKPSVTRPTTTTTTTPRLGGGIWDDVTNQLQQLGTTKPQPQPTPQQPKPQQQPVPYSQIGIGERIVKEHPDEILDAIRHAEGTSTYGIMGLPKGASETQARQWARNTMYSKYSDWEKAGKPGDFLQYLASKYAPIGAGNDPTNLNANWLPNVSDYLAGRGLMPRTVRAGMTGGERAQAIPETPVQVGRRLQTQEEIRQRQPMDIAQRMFGGFQLPAVAEPSTPTGIAAAGIRGYARGLTQPISELSPAMQEPVGETGPARWAETGGEWAGFISGVGGGLFKLADKVMPGAVAGLTGTILRNTGAGGLYGILTSIIDRHQELSRMPPEQAAAEVAKDAAMYGVSFGGTAGAMHVAIGGLLKVAGIAGPTVVSGLRAIRDYIAPHPGQVSGVAAPTAASQAVARGGGRPIGIVSAPDVLQWIDGIKNNIDGIYRAYAPAEAPPIPGTGEVLPSGKARTKFIARIRNRLLGDNEIYAVKSQNLWLRDVEPRVDAMSRSAGDQRVSDRAARGLARSTLRGAISLYIDRMGDPAEYDQHIQQAIVEDPRLAPYHERMLKMSPEEKTFAEQTINVNDQARGAYRVAHGVMDQVREWHVNHVYDPADPQRNPLMAEGTVQQGARGGRLTPSSGFSGQRTFATIPRATVEGALRIRSLDTIDLNRLADGDTGRAILAKNIRDSLEGEKAGKWFINSDQAQKEGYTANLGNELRTFRKTAPIMDVQGQPVPPGQPEYFQRMPDGSMVPVTPEPREMNFWVYPEVERAIRFMYEADPFQRRVGGKPEDILGTLMNYNTMMKWYELRFSMFHDWTLSRVYAYMHPISALRGMKLSNPGIYQKWGPVSEGMKLIQGLDPVMQRLLRGGLKLDRPIDVAYYNLVGGEKKWGPDVMGLAQKHDKALWHTLQPALKAYDAYQSFENVTRKFAGRLKPNGQPWTEDDHAEAVASIINNRYGGLNWDRFGTTRMMRTVMRSLMLAPDWTTSNMRLGFSALRGGFNPLSPGTLFANTPEAYLARQALTRSSLTFMGLLQGVSLMVNGHTTFQNDGGRWYSIELPYRAPDGRKLFADFLLPGELKDLYRIANNIIPGPNFDPGAAFLQARSKLSPALSGLVTATSKTDFQGRPYIDPGMSASQKMAAYTTQLAPRIFPLAAPIALQPWWQYVADPQNFDIATTIGRSTGAVRVERGALLPATTWGSLPRANREEFLQSWLNEDQRADLMQQLGTGRLTGQPAEQLQRYLDIYHYRQKQAIRGEPPDVRYRPYGERAPGRDPSLVGPPPHWF